jgi:hypothetical protein
MNEEMCAMREEMCTMTKQLGQLKEMLKSMGYQSPNPLLAAHKKPTAKNEGPTYWPKLDFVFPRWELYRRFWNLMEFMARPLSSPFTIAK